MVQFNTFTNNVRSYKYLSMFAFTSADMAELAASTTPVLLVLFLWTIIDRKTEVMERLTAHLTKYHLKNIEMYFCYMFMLYSMQLDL